MILEGKIIKVVSSQDGIGKASGKPWLKYQYLLETNEKYPRNVVFDVFGEDRVKELALIPGEDVRLGVDAESREYNGKWYTSLSAWGRVDDEGKRVVAPAGQAAPAEQAASMQVPQATAQAAVGNDGDLPF